MTAPRLVRMIGPLEDEPAAPAPPPIDSTAPVTSDTDIAGWYEAYCPTHGRKQPCMKCAPPVVAPTAADTLGPVWELNWAGNSIRAQAFTIWNDVVKSAGIDPKAKCVHGHYLYEFYCEVCRLSSIDPSYDSDVYRTEIGKATKAASKSLTGVEGRKDWKDLNQIVDIEIWKASRKYGSEMNEGLAYTIAKNQSGKFITQRIEGQTAETTDPNGNTFRIPRTISLDDERWDDDGGTMPSAAEVELVAAKLREEQSNAGEGEEFNPVHIPALQTLVLTWRGSKRLVGEAMLRPQFSVHKVPGVSKSDAARVRQVVLREFKSFVNKALTT
jgi:hypothetical protein